MTGCLKVLETWRKAEGCGQADDAKGNTQMAGVKESLGLQTPVVVLTSHWDINTHLHLLGIGNRLVSHIISPIRSLPSLVIVRRHFLGASTLSYRELSSLERNGTLPSPGRRDVWVA